MKTNKVEFLCKVIALISRNNCTYSIDSTPKTNELDFMECYCKNNKSYFGIYFHRNYIEFWVNDMEDRPEKHSVRYIFRVESEEECYSYMQFCIANGSEWVIRNYNYFVTDKI